jgi:hypothetical protein
VPKPLPPDAVLEGFGCGPRSLTRLAQVPPPPLTPNKASRTGVAGVMGLGGTVGEGGTKANPFWSAT